MCEFRRHRFTGRQHPAQTVQAHAFLGEHALDQGRHAFQHGDALALDMGQQTLRVVGDGVRHDSHPRAEQRRGKELPDRNIEALRGGLGDHIGFAQVQVWHLAQLVVEHAALLDHHPLRQTGGARGIDHVGEIVRAAVEARIHHRYIARLHLFPDQQLRSIGAPELIKQCLCLLAASLSADQQRRAAQVDDPAQTLTRQSRVQWQVTRARLEAADDHAQQIEITFGQQRHRLIQPDAGRDQRMAEAVAALVQLKVTVSLIQATGGHPLRMPSHLRFEQLDVTLLQRIIVLALVTAMDQELLFLGTQQRQVSHVAMEAFNQCQQQTLELPEHALDGRLVEITLVVGQVQPEVIARIAHSGQREIGVGTARIRGRVEALRTVQHRDFHRRIFEHEQAVEQRLALGQLAVFLNVHQWQVFVLAQLHVAVEQAAQPLAHAATLVVFRHFHPKRDAVDEQADGALHLRHLHRTSGHGNAEQHVAIAAQAPQYQGPRRLGEGVDGQLMRLGQLAQLHAVTGIEPGVAVTDDHAATVTGMFAQERPVTRNRRGAFETLQVGFPPLPCLGQALALQPADVIAITRRHRQLRFPTFVEGGIDLEEIVHQQRTAPGIDQDVMVAHHEPVARRADPDQTQVEGCLVEQIETGLALAFEQRLQRRLLFGFSHRRPVQVLDRRVARFVDHLQHVFADVPAERRSQGFVTGDHRLPGLGETLRVELAVNAVTVLHVVEAGARFQQGVQQHAFLHGRQWVDVLDDGGGNRQRIELRLGQPGQREVRRRQAARVVLQAMLDQALQLREISLRQFADGLRVVAFGAEGPAQHQLTPVDLTVDAELVGQQRFRIVRGTDRLIHRTEHCIIAETLVELAEVVERDRRHRQCSHGLAAQIIGQVAQYAVTQTFVWHRAQLFLDRLDRGALPGGFCTVDWRQSQRISTGKPADGAGQVDLVEQGFAAVAFELNQCRLLTTPAAQHAGQCRQQQVVDLGAIGTWRLLQQLPGAVAVEAHADGLCMAILPTALGTFTGQLRGRPCQLRLPPAQFFAQGFAAGIRLQACGPVFEGTGFCRQFDRLLRGQLAIRGLQVVQQHPPGNPVHHQVVNDDEQPLPIPGRIDQQCAHQRSLLEVEAALGIGEQRGAFIHGRYVHLPEHRRLANRLVFCRPLPCRFSKTQAQGVMLIDHGQQCRFKSMGFQGQGRFQQQRLVPVLTLWNFSVEEPVLDRRQPRLARDQTLFGAELLGTGRHGRQGLHGLVLEQVPRAEVNALLPRPADHLDRQNRVAAQFEEVVVEPHLLDVQHFAPDVSQGQFKRVARRHVLLAVQLRIRCRQCATVEFAVGGQRPVSQQDQVRGHHVIRQLRFEVSLEGFAQSGLLPFVLLGDRGDHVAHQLFTTGCIERQHHRFT
ncbi:hypothetical protein PS639_01035 [Pseudomonas fluorescens]|nr:hypothetical protein PS639_01035 [Pseudomonas fluorescens]